MRSQKVMGFLVLGIIGVSVALAALTPVSAQSVLGVRVTVPFDFVVGNERLQAGDYDLRPDTTGQEVLAITNRGERTSLKFMADFDGHPVPQGRARLVFHRYQDRYFLREVWMTGAESYELPESRAERLIKRELAQSGPRSVEILTVAGD